VKPENIIPIMDENVFTIL